MLTSQPDQPGSAVHALSLDTAGEPAEPVPPEPPRTGSGLRRLPAIVALFALAGLSAGYLVARNAQPAPVSETTRTTATTLLTIEATEHLPAPAWTVPFTAGPAGMAQDGAPAPGVEVVTHRFDRIWEVILDGAGAPWTSGEAGVIRWDPADGAATVYAAEQGVPPGATVYAGSPAGGDVWVSGGDALLHYDGGDWWRHAPASPWPDLSFMEVAAGPDGSVWALAVDPDGMLLLGSRSDPPFAGAVEAIRVPEQIVFARSPTVDASGAVWMIGEGMHPPAMVGRYAAGVWSMFAGRPDPESLAATADGDVWMSTTSALFRFDGESWNRLVFAGGSDRSMLLAPPAGGLWAVQFSCCIESDPYVNVSLHEDGRWAVIHNRLRIPASDWGWEASAAIDADGTLWLGSEAGLHRYDGAAWSTFTLPGGVPLGWAEWAAVDAAGTLWVGNFDQLASFDEESWTDRGSLAEVWGRMVHEASLFSGPDGTVWAWARGPAALARLDGSSWTAIDFPDAIYGVPANFALVAGAAGTLWLVGPDVLHHFDGSGWQQVEPAPGAELLGPVTVDDCMSESGWFEVETAGVATPTGSLWVGTCTGLLHFDGTAWSSPLGGVQVMAVETAADGSLWVATSGGVWRLAGTWERVGGLPPGDPYPGRGNREEDPFVWALAAGADGTVWMAGDGLWRASNGTVASVLEDVWIEDLVVGRDGTVWAIGDALYQIIPATATGGSS